MLLKVNIEFKVADEILVANSSDNWDDLDVIAAILDLEVVGNEGVIFEPNGYHLAVWADIEAEWGAVMVPTLKRHCHAYISKVKELDIMIVASCHYKQDLLLLALDVWESVGRIGVRRLDFMIASLIVIQTQNLYLIDYFAVESKHQLWVYQFIAPLVIGAGVVVLTVSIIMYTSLVVHQLVH